MWREDSEFEHVVIVGAKHTSCFISKTAILDRLGFTKNVATNKTSSQCPSCGLNKTYFRKFRVKGHKQANTVTEFNTGLQNIILERTTFGPCHGWAVVADDYTGFHTY